MFMFFQANRRDVSVYVITFWPFSTDLLSFTQFHHAS